MMNVFKSNRIIKSTTLNFALIGFSVSIILYLTLLNRHVSPTRGFLSIGWTFQEIVGGNRQVLIESLENILLFLPLGFFLSRFSKLRFLLVFMTGLLLSFAIELLQFVLFLGWSEFDDVLYNSLGTVLGFGIAKKITGLLIEEPVSLRFYLKLFSFVIVCVCLVEGFNLCNMIRIKDKMIKFASYQDIDENNPNLLVLNGSSGLVKDTEISIKYNSDGTMSIIGSSNIRTWKLISEFELNKGRYVFSGLSGIDKEIVALELERFDDSEMRFVRFTPDIGPIDSYEFEIEENVLLRAYIGIYECTDVDVVATPSLYRID